jgi:hypothetical protein
MESGFRPREYDSAASALVPILDDLPGKIVAIDGYPGVGKTSLGRFLAWRSNVSLVETDLFLTEGHGRMMHRKEEIARIIKKRIDIPRPVIVEGCAVLRLLADLNRSPDFLIYLTSQDAPIVHGDLAADLTAYDAKFSPRSLAGLALAIDQSIRADGSLGCTN